MQLKNFLNWFKYSGVWVGFVLNPYQWEPDFKLRTNNDMPDSGGNVWGIMFLELNLGLIWIRIIIDDGRW